MPAPICPACQTDNTETIDSVDRANLIGSYRQKGIDEAIPARYMNCFIADVTHLMLFAKFTN